MPLASRDRGIKPTGARAWQAKQTDARQAAARHYRTAQIETAQPHPSIAARLDQWAAIHRARDHYPMATWEIVPLVERFELLASMWDLASTWPPFMLKDPIGNRLFGKVPELFPEYQLLALDGDGHLVGRLIAAPFPYDGNLQSLPDRGWDAVLEEAVEGNGQRAPTAVSLLEARIAPAAQGQGLSHTVLAAARSHVARLGYRDLFGPVRPTAKAAEPQTPMSEYVGRLQADGLPVDPWLRVHVRLGGQIVKVCPTSMTVPGTLAEWRAWTGLRLTTSGPHDVPGALVPIHVSVEHDHCVYVEPNVWIHHRLDPQSLPRSASPLD